MPTGPSGSRSSTRRLGGEVGPYTPGTHRTGHSPSSRPLPPSGVLRPPFSPALPPVPPTLQAAGPWHPGATASSTAHSEVGLVFVLVTRVHQGAGPSGTRGRRKPSPRPRKSSRKPTGAQPPPHPAASIPERRLRRPGPLCQLPRGGAGSLTQALPPPRRPAHSAHPSSGLPTLPLAPTQRPVQA